MIKYAKTTDGADGEPPATGSGVRGSLVVADVGLARRGDRRVLTAAEFQELSAVPLEAEWFANIDNPRTRRAYRIDIHEFMAFMGISQPEEFRKVTRAHVLAWRKDLETRELGGATIRRKLAALSCDANAVTHNPVKGVKAPQGGELLELTPFRGHFIFWEGGVHDVETKKCISAGVPATDGRVGPVGPQPGRAVAGV